MLVFIGIQYAPALVEKAVIQLMSISGLLNIIDKW